MADPLAELRSALVGQVESRLDSVSQTLGRIELAISTIERDLGHVQQGPATMISQVELLEELPTNRETLSRWRKQGIIGGGTVPGAKGIWYTPGEAEQVRKVCQRRCRSNGTTSATDPETHC